VALHQLAGEADAKAEIDELWDLCKEEQFAKDKKAQGFLAEAEKLILGEKQSFDGEPLRTVEP
jgi:hypothetical protein